MTTQQGKSWLLQKMRDTVNPPSQGDILRARSRQRGTSTLGRMYFYLYDAKGKEVLPYWDKFPLVIPIEQYSDGFLGLNLHYISPGARMALLSGLKQFVTGSKNDERTRIQLSYPLLKATHRAYAGLACVKRYLYPHIRSRFIEILPHEWEIASQVPVQNFKSLTQPITAPEVWAESAGK